MRKRKNLLSFILFLLVLSGLLLFFSSKRGFAFVRLSGEVLLSPVRHISATVFDVVPKFAKSKSQKSLEEENSRLKKQLVNQKELERENKALKDQFRGEWVESTQLLPAQIVGAPSFLPTITIPEKLVISRGSRDGVEIGNGVIIQNSIVGKISKVSYSLSEVQLISDKRSRFTVKTNQTQALGIVKGTGSSDLLMDNVVLSDTLQKGDIVVTMGDMEESGKGFPPNLIVGTITSVEKKPSALFQTARVESNVDFAKLSLIFIIVAHEK